LTEFSGVRAYIPYYEDRYRQRVLSNLQRRAKSMGFVLQQADKLGIPADVS